jgi:hypothetical protein
VLGALLLGYSDARLAVIGNPLLSEARRDKRPSIQGQCFHIRVLRVLHFPQANVLASLVLQAQLLACSSFVGWLRVRYFCFDSFIGNVFDQPRLKREDPADPVRFRTSEVGLGQARNT